MIDIEYNWIFFYLLIEVLNFLVIKMCLIKYKVMKVFYWKRNCFVGKNWKMIDVFSLFY